MVSQAPSMPASFAGMQSAMLAPTFPGYQTFAAVTYTLLHLTTPYSLANTILISVYSQQGDVVLTGVGSAVGAFNRGVFSAPTDSCSRWDDPGYDPQQHSERDRFGVLRQERYNGRHGFIFHEACWSLLEKAYGSEPVPLERFYNLCNSLPLWILDNGQSPGSGVDWGHKFGGLIYMDVRPNTFFPWERSKVLWHCKFGWFGDDFGPLQHPFVAQTIEELLLPNPDSNPVPVGDFDDRAPREPASDPFYSLPVEVRSLITFELTTEDALNLRKSSRAFYFLFESQQFWASRIRRNGKRSCRWLFEAENIPGPLDWRQICRNILGPNRPPELWNRERIWDHIEMVQDILALSEPDPDSVEKVQGPGASDTSGLGIQASGHLVGRSERTYSQPYLHFNEGSHCFNTQRVAIPKSLSQIAFSFVRLGDGEYLAGMRLIPSNGEDIQIGYRDIGNERFLDITAIAGLVLAVLPRGFRAVQCIMPDGKARSWIGCPADVPRTQRLVPTTPVTELHAGFDVSFHHTHTFPLKVLMELTVS